MKEIWILVDLNFVWKSFADSLVSLSFISFIWNKKENRLTHTISSATVDNQGTKSASYEILNIIEIVYPNNMSIAPMSILNWSLMSRVSKVMIMMMA